MSGSDTHLPKRVRVDPPAPAPSAPEPSGSSPPTATAASAAAAVASALIAGGMGGGERSAPPSPSSSVLQAPRPLLSTLPFRELRSIALQLCRNFLGGSWADMTPKDFVIRPIMGGLTNKLYKCTSRNPEHELHPPAVLLRLYCDHDILDRVKDAVLCAIFSERGLGPTLYGVFAGGRLEHFFESRTLTTDELRDPHYSRLVAREMANLHTMVMPINKNPGGMEKALRKMLKQARELETEDEERQAAKTALMARFRCAAKVGELVALLSRLKPDIVLCHNDVQEGNILRLEDGSLQLIDFEYTAYRHSGFDIGNHFCECTVSYGAEFGEHGFVVIPEKYPTEEQQRVFAEAYLQRRRALAVLAARSTTYGTPFSPVTTPAAQLPSVPPPSASEIAETLLAANCYALASHLYWGLWSLASANSPIDFGWLAYAEARLTAYEDHLHTRVAPMLSAAGMPLSSVPAVLAAGPANSAGGGVAGGGGAGGGGAGGGSAQAARAASTPAPAE